MQRSGSKSAVESLEREMEMTASTETCRWPDLLPLLTIAAAAVATLCHRWGLCSTKSLLVCVYIQVSPDQECVHVGSAPWPGTLRSSRGNQPHSSHLVLPSCAVWTQMAEVLGHR